MIARALVNRPQLLIFDEATSSLDPSSEQEICSTICSLRGDHTVLCASHRPMLVDYADHVIDLGMHEDTEAVPVSEVRAHS